MKKILLSLFWIITIWLINFSSAWLVRSSDYIVNIFEPYDRPYTWTWSSFLCFDFSDFRWYFEFHPSSDSVVQFETSPEYSKLNWSSCFYVPDSSFFDLDFVDIESFDWSPLSLTWFQYYYEEESLSPTCSSWSCTINNYLNFDYTWTFELATWNAITSIITFWNTPTAKPFKTMCFRFHLQNITNNQYFLVWFGDNASTIGSDAQQYWWDQNWQTVCLYANKLRVNLRNPTTTRLSWYFEAFFLPDFLQKSVPCEDWMIWSSQAQCESDYNLIPVSSVNSSYCQNNNLCPLIPDIDCWTGDWIWSGDWNWSALWINNIQHLWAANLFINIPEEIWRDYAYTNNWNNMNIDVEWYNVDYEYIEWVINKQSYIPTSEDLSNVFSNLGLFWSLLVVCLFVILVFYMFKKIF